MKLFSMISKNLKLLFRNKESAYTIVFGPILIILLVSFAFMGGSDVEVDLGVHPASDTDLSRTTIDTLNEKYAVNVYPDNETCIDAVRTGSTHACIVFGQPEDGVTPVTFHLDFSRMDLVYRVIDDLSGELNLQADVLREQLASNALLRMETSAQLVQESRERAELVQEGLEQALDDLSRAERGMESIPNETLNITDIRPLSGYHLGLASNTRHVAEESLAAFEQAKAVINDLEDECDECSDAMYDRVEEAEDTIDEAEDVIYRITEDAQPQQLEEAQLLLRFAIEDLEAVQGTIRNASTSGAVVSGNLGEAIAGLESSAGELDRIVSRLAYTEDFLRGQETRPEALSVPVQIRTENIAVSDTQLGFAYPYLLVLVIMFIGMLLASMLVVTDKTSRAAFRNFTTPTGETYHVLVSFFTAFCILVLEVAAILLLSVPFVATPLFTHVGSTLLLITVAIVVFTFLGMLIGYLSTTQEAAMITSISLGSVLLFVSNLVIPIEGMNSVVRSLSAFNPYIVLSELLRRSMVYGVTTRQVARELLILSGFIVVMLVVIVFVQRRLKQAYFQQDKELIPLQRLPAPLNLGGKMIYDEVDLIDALDRMTRDEFERLVPHKENRIAEWAEKELRNKRLARRLRTTSKERMILKLDKYLKRHGKHLKR